MELSQNEGYVMANQNIYIRGGSRGVVSTKQAIFRAVFSRF